MKIIDLLNKIANGEEVPQYIRYKDISKHKYNTMMVCKENIIYQLDQCVISLNDEVEILEEKEMLEKLEYEITDNGELSINGFTFDYEQKIQIIDTLNQVIDYLKSKGDE